MLCKAGLCICMYVCSMYICSMYVCSMYVCSIYVFMYIYIIPVHFTDFVISSCQI